MATRQTAAAHRHAVADFAQNPQGDGLIALVLFNPARVALLEFHFFVVFRHLLPVDIVAFVYEYDFRARQKQSPAVTARGIPAKHRQIELHVIFELFKARAKFRHSKDDAIAVARGVDFPGRRHLVFLVAPRCSDHRENFPVFNQGDGLF